MKPVLLIAVQMVSIQIWGADVHSFCDFGHGMASTLGQGAVWDQEWGQEPREWFTCPAEPNENLLDSRSRGALATEIDFPEGIPFPPVIDGVLYLHFTGELGLTAHDAGDCDAVTGEIRGEIEGWFIADLRSPIVDEEAGTIGIRFGEPGQLGLNPVLVVGGRQYDLATRVQVTGTTGKFRHIRAVGSWGWHVSGIITANRVASLSVQENIMAALNEALSPPPDGAVFLRGAEEEIVLTGSYVTGDPLFIRGETNHDGIVDLADVIPLLLRIFLDAQLSCLSTADVNDDGRIDVADPIYLLQYLFLRGPAPAMPFPECGVDQTEDDLTCTAYPGCP